MLIISWVFSTNMRKGEEAEKGVLKSQKWKKNPVR